MKRFFLLIVFYSCVFYSQGPQSIATVSRDFWKLPLNSEKDFDVASKMEMLVFVQELSTIENLDSTQLSALIDVKSANTINIEKWKKQSKNRIQENFKNLSESALEGIIPVEKNASYDKIVVSSSKLNTSLPSHLKEWYLNSKVFYKTYILECIRLAAKNPKRTSEIDVIDPSEKNGFELKDKSYLLTFDDGPTANGGETDKVVSMLKKENLSGIFFLSGDKLKSRLQATGKSNLVNLYGENWIGSHSMVHKSHQYLNDWKAQIDECDSLIKSIFNLSNETFYFRPPYGQRTLEMTKYLLSKKQPILLWNIDSQDWSSKINAQEVSSRVIALMLLWRKGIILFHDVHSKSSTAVPKINEYFKNSNVKWLQPSDIN